MNLSNLIESSAFIDNSLIKRFVTDYNKGLPGHQWLAIFYLIPMSMDLRARNGSFTTPWHAPCDPIFKIPDLSNTGDSLDIIYDQRAIELLDAAKSSNRKIMIQWSGGVDSTALLVSFLKNSSPGDRELFTVAMSSNSIIENINFYKKYIHKKIKVINWLDVDVSNEFLSSTMLLHGDPANCLYGPSGMMYSHLVKDKKHLKSWKDQLPVIAQSIDKQGTLWSNGISIGDWFVEKISDNLISSGLDQVETVADWWWYYYFNFKWFGSIVRPLAWCRRNYKAPISRENYEFFAKNAFYAGKKFQSWSYNNLQKLIGEDPTKTFKIDAKKYIFDFVLDDQYQRYKKFHGSRNTNHHDWALSLQPVLFDKNWIGHQWSEPGVQESMLECIENYQ